MNLYSQIESNKSLWIKQVKAGNSKAIELLYRVFREDFIQWLQRNQSCSREEARDIFQESVMALYKGIKTGKITEIQMTVKAYLFGIGKKVYLNKLRKKQIETTGMENVPNLSEELFQKKIEEESLNNLQKNILKLLEKMRNPCRAIIYSFYYKGWTMQEIAEEMGYRNARVVKSQKVRCIGTLRKRVGAVAK